MDPTKLKGVFIHDDYGNQHDGKPHLYLYNDNPHTTDDYGERLQRLLQYVQTDWRDIRGDRRTRYEMARQGVLGAE